MLIFSLFPIFFNFKMHDCLFFKLFLPLCVARSFTSRWMWCQIRRTKTLVMAPTHKIPVICVKCCDKDILKSACAQEFNSVSLLCWLNS